jgi:VWFA-related protein
VVHTCARHLAIGVLTGLPLAALAQPAPQNAPPQYRSGTDIVTVDVTVLDRSGEPAATLKTDDFTLTVDGRPRAIQSVRLMRREAVMASPSQPPAAPPGRPPEATSILSPPRRFVLVIDREHIPVGEGQQMLAAAVKFVDALPPAEHVALWTTAQTTSSVRFDESRDALKQRIRLSTGTYRYPSLGRWNIGRDEAIRAVDEGITPRIESSPDPTRPAVVINPGTLQDIVNRECTIPTQVESCLAQVQAQVQEVARDARDRADVLLANLGNLVDALGALDGPKPVVLVTGGPVFTKDNTTIVTRLAARAAQARVVLHALQVRDPGYQARTDQMRASTEVVDQNASAAYMLAGATGGLAITPVSGETGFSRLARELSAAYVLAFEVEPGDRDGKVHQIDVQVRDRGWGGLVRARKTFRVEARRVEPVALPVAPSVPATAAPTPPAAVAAPMAPARPPDRAPAPPVAAAPAPTSDPEVDQVVRKMAEYVAAYGPQASVIVGVEKYSQQVTVEERPLRPRSLVAEFAIVKAPDRVGWTGFRDVVEVDGRAVADRRDRLASLLTGPAGGEAELRRIADESARYNVGPIIRNFNVPTTALFFFHPALVDRFSFRRGGTKTIDGVSTWVLDFKETKRPTIVGKRDGTNVPCEGTVWVSPADGTIVRTKLRLRNFANAVLLREMEESGGLRAATGQSGSPTPLPVQGAQGQGQTPAQPQPQPGGGGQPQAGGGSTQGQGTGGASGASQGRGQDFVNNNAKALDQDAMNVLAQDGGGIVELQTLVDVEVTYRRAADSGMWLPDKMTEVYEGPIPRGTRAPIVGRAVGLARYSDFKRFETSVKIVLPK